MPKQKCDTCLITHGGFHLCVGRPVTRKEQRPTAISMPDPEIVERFTSPLYPANTSQDEE